MLATSNYYQTTPKTKRAAPDRQGQKKPAPNAEANEAGHGPKAVGVRIFRRRP